MEIIHQLGINSAVFVQFGIFICTFYFLNLYVFTPYHKAHEERENRTLGGEDLAHELQRKSTELHSEYQLKAKEVTRKIKDIYDGHRADALKEFDSLVGKARSDSKALLEANNLKIAQSVQAASVALTAEGANLSVAITQKLLGK
jgi:F0F1-type ATP synthase membrane subunit b/b'